MQIGNLEGSQELVSLSELPEMRATRDASERLAFSTSSTDVFSLINSLNDLQIAFSRTLISNLPIAGGILSGSQETEYNRDQHDDSSHGYPPSDSEEDTYYYSDDYSDDKLEDHDGSEYEPEDTEDDDSDY
ncbi:unnamed protein product [Mucor hiemalis]